MPAATPQLAPTLVFHARAEEEARAGWGELYEGSLHACMHGAHCQQGPGCHVGRRLTGVTILSGSVVRIWDRWACWRRAGWLALLPAG